MGSNPTGAWIFVCCDCRVLSGRGLRDELITRPEESYRLCCVVVCDLETSRIGAPYIYDISKLRVNHCVCGCMFCILLFNSVIYVFLLLRLCILIVTYVLFCIFRFHHANWVSSATLTEVFPCFFLSCKANARV